jgi:ACR3 family arsenite efflux pump ArsB
MAQHKPATAAAPHPQGSSVWSTLSFLQKNLVWSIPACMILGILFGTFASAGFLRQTVIPLTFLMVYPMMVNLNIKEVFNGGDTRLQLVVQFMNFGLIPFIGFGIGKLFFADAPLIIVGLLLTSLLPTSGMTISWTGFARGNMPAAVKMTVVGLVLGSLATPFYLQFLMGTVIDIPLANVFQQIVLIVFLPMAAGYATQRYIIWKAGKEQYQKKWKPRFPPISTLGVLGIVFVAMALKAQTIVATPLILLELLVPLVVLYGLNFALSTIIGKLFFKRGDAIALVYGTVMRNLSIALAIAMTVFGADGAEIALIIAVAYIIQVQAAAWYVRFTDRIFGSDPQHPAEVTG